MIILSAASLTTVYAQTEISFISDAKMMKQEPSINRPLDFSSYFIIREDQYYRHVFGWMNDFNEKNELSHTVAYQTYHRVMNSLSQNIRHHRFQNWSFSFRLPVPLMFSITPNICPEGYMRMSSTTSGPLNNCFLKIPAMHPS